MFRGATTVLIQSLTFWVYFVLYISPIMLMLLQHVQLHSSTYNIQTKSDIEKVFC